MYENIIIVDDLPIGYRIILNAQDEQYYLQRAHNGGGWDRIVTRTMFHESESYLDIAIPCETEEIARDLIAYDHTHPHQASNMSVVYTQAEIQIFLEMQKIVTRWKTMSAELAYTLDMITITPEDRYTGVVSHKMAVPISVTLQNQKDFIAKYREMRGIKLDK